MNESSKWPTLEGRLNNPITDELTALLQLKESVPLSEQGEKRLKQLLEVKDNVNMNKPRKPKKPSKRDAVPTLEITVQKLLVWDILQNKFLLIDEKSHPDIFCDPETNAVNDELDPYYDKMDNMGLDWGWQILKYSHYKQIERDNNLKVDFEVIHRRNCDGYYDCSIVEYKIMDPDFKQKLDVYNNRFVIYEKQLADYESELKKYDQYIKIEKKRKLQDRLDKL